MCTYLFKHNTNIDITFDLITLFISFIGLVISGNEISQILFSVILSYAGGQRNRPRWLAWGVVFCAISCYILALPHFIYGAGEDALHLTKEYQQEHATASKYLVGINICIQCFIFIMFGFLFCGLEHHRSTINSCGK